MCLQPVKIISRPAGILLVTISAPTSKVTTGAFKRLLINPFMFFSMSIAKTECAGFIVPHSKTVPPAISVVLLNS